MYGWKDQECSDEVSYRMYCQSRGKIPCESLPPCNDIVELHMMRANYQAHIWRQSLIAEQTQLDPLNHGWTRNEHDNNLEVKWMRCNPAPDEVLL